MVTLTDLCENPESTVTRGGKEISTKSYNTRAVILGSGMAGLLAARVASEFYDEVVVVERDAKPSAPVARKGVPQGHHIHVLLKRGEDILEELFPGMRRALVDSGSIQRRLGRDVKWFLAGRWMPSFAGGMVTFFQSRPLLEFIVREFVQKIEIVKFRYSSSFQEFEFDAEKENITSVRVKDRETGEEESLFADAFIDATGRGSLLLRHLEKIGISSPMESRVGVDFAYSSGVFELEGLRPEGDSAILVYPKAPEETRAAALVPVEGNKWMATAAGYNGDHPPIELDGFLDFVGSVSQKDIHSVLKDAKLIGSLKQFKFKSGVRRYFEKSADIPKGLLVIGDAICSANPFFGQGISVAAQEAIVLREMLVEQGPRVVEWSEKGRRGYYKRISKILDISWGLAIGEDLKYASTTGKRPLGYSISRRMKDIIMSSDSPVVANKFYKVMHFVDRPMSLFSPRILKSLLWGDK